MPSLEAADQSHEQAINAIETAWRNGRPIVPFVGAGVSAAAGYPVARRITGYLALVRFALKESLYRARYPLIEQKLEAAVTKYGSSPATFLADFGWPDPGQLNTDVWHWLGEKPRSTTTSPGQCDETLYREPQQIIQSILHEVLAENEPNLAALIQPQAASASASLQGDWTALLDSLSEGRPDLIDALFADLEVGRNPTRAHIFLTFLTQLMGIRLILSLNFDTFLEQAMQREGLDPRIFDIHRDADLPHPSLVQRQLSIVKLHGSAYGLRLGERLQYSLEHDAKERIVRYLPDDALLVVVGFSGWERRMMQVIAEFAKRRAQDSGTTQVVWLTPQPHSTRSPFLSKLERDLFVHGRRSSLEIIQISDANTFLPGLFLRLANCFPPARRRYEALVSRPVFLTPPDRLPADHPFSKLVAPAVVLLRDSYKLCTNAATSPDNGPSSWPSLAAAELAACESSRDTIWVDLENHHTVEAIVRDVLAQIHRLDPRAPDLLLPTEPAIADPLRPPSRQDPGELTKAVKRIRQALQRGRYLLVFDSLESFCRPPLVHHGVPRWVEDAERYRRELFLPSIQRLCDFLCMLVGTEVRTGGPILPPLRDTIVVLTATAVAERHAESGGVVNQFAKTIRDQLTILFDKRLTKQAVQPVSNTGIGTLNWYPFCSAQVPDSRATQKSAQHDRKAIDVAEVFSAYRRNSTADGPVKLCANILYLRRRLRRESPPEQPSQFNGEMALLALLSFFRRPRPRPVIHSLVARWVFPAGESTYHAGIAKAYESIDVVLRCLASDGAIEWYEGDTIWIPRQIHEPLYEALTSPLRVRELPERLVCPEQTVAILLAGLMAASWHQHIARTYFSEVYLASHDEQAFFEYIYHRVSGLRYLTVLQALLDNVAGDSTAAIAHLDKLLKPFERFVHYTPAIPRPNQVQGGSNDDFDNCDDLYTLIAKRYPLVAGLIHGLDALSAIRRDESVRHHLAETRERHIDRAVTPDMLRRELALALYHCRRDGVNTLQRTLERETNRITATATPDTWLGWISQLLTFELPEIAGQWSKLKKVHRLPSSFSLDNLSEQGKKLGGDAHSIALLCDSLGDTLVRLKLRLLRSRLSYRRAENAAASAISAIVCPSDSDAADTLAQDIGQWCANDGQTGSEGLRRALTASRAEVEGSVLTPKAVHLLRLWCECARGAAGEGRRNATSIILSEVRTLLNLAQERRVSRDGARLPTDLRRISYDVRKAQAEVTFHDQLMWSFFDSGRDGLGEGEYYVPTHAEIERRAEQTEQFVRTWATSTADYAIGRSHGLTVRARSLYLSEQFREGHRLLTLSMNDLGQHSDREFFSRSVACLARAELLTISAEAHLMHYGRVASAGRKLETAIEHLDNASRWLDRSGNRSMWWLRLYVGKAQVRHEQILLEVRRLAQSAANKVYPSGDRYPGLTLWLEQCALDGLASLRSALDMLPFSENLTWAKAKAHPSRSPLLQLEAKALALWVQLFVAAFGYSQLLTAVFDLTQVRDELPARENFAVFHEWTKTAVARQAVPALETLVDPLKFWINRWRQWCELRGFYQFARLDHLLIPLLNQAMSSAHPSARDGNRTTEKRTFREDLLEMERHLIRIGEAHGSLWDARRIPNQAPPYECTLMDT